MYVGHGHCGSCQPDNIHDLVFERTQNRSTSSVQYTHHAHSAKHLSTMKRRKSSRVQSVFERQGSRLTFLDRSIGGKGLLGWGGIRTRDLWAYEPKIDDGLPQSACCW